MRMGARERESARALARERESAAQRAPRAPREARAAHSPMSHDGLAQEEMFPTQQWPALTQRSWHDAAPAASASVSAAAKARGAYVEAISEPDESAAETAQEPERNSPVSGEGEGALRAA